MGRSHEGSHLDVDLPIWKEVLEAELGGRAQLLRDDLCETGVEVHALLGEVSPKPMAKQIDALKRGQVRPAPDLEIRADGPSGWSRANAASVLDGRKVYELTSGFLRNVELRAALKTSERDRSNVLVDVVENASPMRDARQLRHVRHEWVQREDSASHLA